MTPACVGSNATSVAPREEPKLDGNVTVLPPEVEVTFVGWASVNVAPPSVDFQTPTPCGSVGTFETGPAIVAEMPCTPRPSATKIVLPLTAIWRTERFAKFELPASGVQVEPSSVDL